MWTDLMKRFDLLFPGLGDWQVIGSETKEPVSWDIPVKDFFRRETLPRAFIEQEIEKFITSFYNRHERCIGTDGDYTDAQWVEMLSASMKRNYEEDSKALQDLKNALLK